MKYVTPRRELDRSSDIEIVIQNTDRMFENDIVTAARIGKDAPRVSVQYGDELPLNQPHVSIEDVPTGCMAVDSPLAELQRSIEIQLDNTDNEPTEEEDKPF